MRLFAKKKFRYGSAQLALTVVFLVLVLLFNIIFTALASHFGWFADMTAEEVFTLSDEAKRILSEVSSDVAIYFCAEPDKLESSVSQKYIYTTACQIAEAFDNVTVECHDLYRENTFFTPYKATVASSITATSVIITSGGESCVYDADSFFILNEDGTSTWAYQGEYRFLSGILQVTSAEKPVAYFTTGHGEDLSAAAALMSLIADSGFEVKPIDLSSEEMTEDARVLVVFDPLYDFLGSEAGQASANEIAKIDAFLDELHHGLLLTFIDADAVGQLDNLNEYLTEWGIAYEPDTVARDYAHAYSVDGKTVRCVYNRDADDFGSTLYTALLELSAEPRTVIRQACPIRVLYTEGGNFAGSRYVSTLLSSFDTAENIADDRIVKTGSSALMTVSLESRINQNNTYFSYVLATSPGYADTNNLITNTYANRDILHAALHAMGRERVLANIDYKIIDDTSLDITMADANGWTASLTLVLPLLIAVCGVAVRIRRKHS